MPKPEKSQIKINKQNLFTLGTLSTTAQRLFGFDQKQVKLIALDLYEKGFISYPLTSETTAFSRDQQSVRKVLESCITSREIEVQVFSHESLQCFNQYAETLFIDDEKANFKGDISGILALDIPDMTTLSSKEYLLFILILTQMKCWFLSNEFQIGLNNIFNNISPMIEIENIFLSFLNEKM